MKDKLVKHGKPAKYFRLRKILIISIIALFGCALVAIPVGISVSQANIQQRS